MGTYSSENPIDQVFFKSQDAAVAIGNKVGQLTVQDMMSGEFARLAYEMNLQNMAASVSSQGHCSFLRKVVEESR